jgi:hypothetical protein
MGAGFNPKIRAYLCSGQQVTAKLNQVFQDPGNPTHPNHKFDYAKQNNFFDQVPLNQKGNWWNLLMAYIRAGVDVHDEWTAWRSYLEDLGTGEDGDPGPAQISVIAQMRYDALTNNTGIYTRTHPNGHVQTSAGVIDSPCPL